MRDFSILKDGQIFGKSYATRNAVKKQIEKLREIHRTSTFHVIINSLTVIPN